MGHGQSLADRSAQPEEEDTGNGSSVNAEEELNRAVGSLICYRMVRLSAVRDWSQWKRYQELQPNEYINYYPIRQELGSGEAFEDPGSDATEPQAKTEWKDDGQAEAKKKLYFISHRWLTPVHPDPEGTQLRRVQNLPPRPELSSAGAVGSSSRMPTMPEHAGYSRQHDPASDVLIFYDFSSLPQEPRTADESEIFKLGIVGLNDILSYMRIVILDDQDYMSRSWCLMEYFISSFKGSLILDEKRDDRMHQLQQLTVAPNQGVGCAKSAIAEAEAIRGSKMGEIAMSFFAESFKNSSVTKGTDRRSIEDVFRTFIRNNIRAWKHEPYVGWKPVFLQGDQVDQILKGERLRLIDLPETGMPVQGRPIDIDTTVPYVPNRFLSRPVSDFL